MPRMIFIRPAETDFFLREQFLGRHDADLNENGRFQAEQLAHSLDAYHLSFLALSPLRRAISTALPLAEVHDLSPHPVAGFHALDFGDWEEHRIPYIRHEDRMRYETWLTDPDFPAPGGESLREVYARAYPELVNIVQQTRQGETIALLLQDAVMRVLCCGALDLPLEAAKRFSMDHGGYAVFERIYPKGPYQLIAWNQTHHLATGAVAGMGADETIEI